MIAKRQPIMMSSAPTVPAKIAKIKIKIIDQKSYNLLYPSMTIIITPKTIANAAITMGPSIKALMNPNAYSEPGKAKGIKIPNIIQRTAPIATRTAAKRSNPVFFLLEPDVLLLGIFNTSIS
jgi:hypothetical protein